MIYNQGYILCKLLWWCGEGGGLMAAGEKIYNEDLWEIKRGKQK